MTEEARKIDRKQQHLLQCLEKGNKKQHMDHSSTSLVGKMLNQKLSMIITLQNAAIRVRTFLLSVHKG